MQATKELMQLKDRDLKITKSEMADAHCHLNMIDHQAIRESVEYGVLTMITNGVDTASNIRNIELYDAKNIFVAAGIDPENAIKISDNEIKFNVNMIKSSRNRIKAIGEIGLDYLKAKSKEQIERQKEIFELFLDLSLELNLPVCIHSRNAIEDVMRITKKKAISRAQMHFFEGDIDDAKEAEKRGYMISIPPLESAKRKRAIKEIDIMNLLAESDSPAASKQPKDVETSIRMISELKGIAFESASQIITSNTKRFFNIGFQAMKR